MMFESAVHCVAGMCQSCLTYVHRLFIVRASACCTLCVLHLEQASMAQRSRCTQEEATEDRIFHIIDPFFGSGGANALKYVEKLSEPMDREKVTEYRKLLVELREVQANLSFPKLLMKNVATKIPTNMARSGSSMRFTPETSTNEWASGSGAYAAMLARH